MGERFSSDEIALALDSTEVRDFIYWYRGEKPSTLLPATFVINGSGDLVAKYDSNGYHTNLTVPRQMFTRWLDEYNGVVPRTLLFGGSRRG